MIQVQIEVRGGGDGEGVMGRRGGVGRGGGTSVHLEWTPPSTADRGMIQIQIRV